MKAKHIIAATMVAASSLLTACGTPSSTTSSRNATTAPVASSYGVIDSIQMVNTSDSRGGIGVGTVVGGVVGGVLGNQVGSGTGRTAATAAGAVGGAVVGNQIDKRKQQKPMYQVGVRLDNGSYQTVMQDSVADLSVGNRVRIENGRAYRY